jgi:hypothetical protein
VSAHPYLSENGGRLRAAPDGGVVRYEATS